MHILPAVDSLSCVFCRDLSWNPLFPQNDGVLESLSSLHTLYVPRHSPRVCMKMYPQTHSCTLDNWQGPVVHEPLADLSGSARSRHKEDVRGASIIYIIAVSFRFNGLCCYRSLTVARSAETRSRRSRGRAPPTFSSCTFVSFFIAALLCIARRWRPLSNEKNHSCVSSVGTYPIVGSQNSRLQSPSCAFCEFTVILPKCVNRYYELTQYALLYIHSDISKNQFTTVSDSVALSETLLSL